MLDPDPDEMNEDPQPWLKSCLLADLLKNMGNEHSLIIMNHHYELVCTMTILTVL
jgi:hypothetical protein